MTGVNGLIDLSVYENVGSDDISNNNYFGCRQGSERADKTARGCSSKC